jgi:hypothetical protein
MRKTQSQNKRGKRAPLLGIVLFGLSGCASSPYVGQGPHPQIERGNPIPPIDIAGWILAIPGKLILWNIDFNSHSISEGTEAVLAGYLDSKNHPYFRATRFRLNQYAPFEDLAALAKNDGVAWPYRIFPGLLVTLLYDVALPGRLFPWGDYYNPYTNTAHLYSDDPAIALHEAGHAWDLATFNRRGTYALIRAVPFWDLHQEWRATDEAIDYLIQTQQRELELEAYRTLWPAFGTYAGGYMPVPLGSLFGAAFGHIAGIAQKRERKHFYEKMEAHIYAQ